MSYYVITYTSTEFKTLGEYCNFPQSPIRFYFSNKKDEFERSLGEFLSFKGDDGRSNEDNILDEYWTEKEKEDYKKLKNSKKEIKFGTKLYIPTEKINRESLLVQGIEVVSNNTPYFKASKLYELEIDRGYIPEENKYYDSSVTFDYPHATVWLWCKALSQKRDVGTNIEFDEIEGELIDITKYVIRLKTTVSKNGGNFNLSLSPVTSTSQQFDTIERGEFDRIEHAIKSQDFDEEGNFLSMNNSFEATVDENNLGEGLRAENRSSYYFHNIISKNDLIFIRFEKLACEKERRWQDLIDFYIDRNRLAGNVYDMVALVDDNSISNSFGNTEDVSIDISGRDLIKLLIDDGTYFFPFENNRGQLRLSGQSQSEGNKYLQRVFGQNTLTYLQIFQFASIEYFLKFIIQNLSNIKITPSSLFTSYNKEQGEQREDKRNQGLRKKKLNDEKIRKEGIIALNRYRNNSDSRDVYLEDGQLKINKGNNASSSYNSFDIELIYNQIQTFLIEIRNADKRRVVNDRTNGWDGFIYNQNTAAGGLISSVFKSTDSLCSENENLVNNEFPIFFKKWKLVNESDIYSRNHSITPIIDLIDKYIDSNQDESENPQQKLDTVSGIWQIIKLVIDSSVSNRRIVDSSMSSMNGSLLNFVRKICQEPFVEFYSDTYGDMFHFIVRKPPFDKESILSYLYGPILTENGEESKLPLIIEIGIDDIEKESLNFNEGEAYSWYHFVMQNIFLGDGNRFSTDYLPAIYFEEYAEYFGNNPLDLVHNYATYNYNSDENSESDISVYEEQAANDLKYLIDTNSYLPFTRSGTIVLTRGDRRIKRGNFIRYKPTGEIFYVESVSQDLNISEGSVIDRKTTIVVSRGMIEDYIKGVKSKDGTIYSYFDIINTELNVVKKTYEKVTERKIPLTGEKLEAKRKEQQQNQVINTQSVNTQTPNLLDGSVITDGINLKFGTGGLGLGSSLSVKKEWDNILFKPLKNDLLKAFKFLGISSARISSVASGSHGDSSRHYVRNSTDRLGHAVDISVINGVAASSASRTTNSIFDKLGEYFRTLGYTRNAEGANARSYLWKTKGHYDHIHISNKLTASSPLANNERFLDTTNTTAKEYSPQNEELYEIVKEKKKVTSLDHTKLFENFKVNQKVFRFFLERKHFNLKGKIIE